MRALAAEEVTALRGAGSFDMDDPAGAGMYCTCMDLVNRGLFDVHEHDDFYGFALTALGELALRVHEAYLRGGAS